MILSGAGSGQRRASASISLYRQASSRRVGRDAVPTACPPPCLRVSVLTQISHEETRRRGQAGTWRIQTVDVTSRYLRQAVLFNFYHQSRHTHLHCTHLHAHPLTTAPP